MKNFKFLFGAFCALGMMASCSSNDDVVEGGGTTPDGGQNLYLSINVMSANEGTRATVSGDPDGAIYEAGTTAENEVNNAYFYFYDADGNAANVVKLGDGTYVNYYASPATSSGADMPNVEKLVDVTVVINTKNGDLIPDKIVAVLNADKALTKVDGTGMSLTELENVVADYRLTADDKYFRMSSSVYSAGGEKKLAVENIQGSFKSSEDLAKAAPVDIYVERVLAKVSVGAGITTDADDIIVGGEQLYYTGQTSDRSDNVDKRLYVKFVGWNVATETTTSYLFKSINGAWTDSDLGITNWTWPNYFRSFWAMNPNGVEYANHDYSDAGQFKVGAVDENKDVVYGAGEGNINYTYIQENASPYSATLAAAAPTNASKIIVASQLVDKNGNASTLAEWKGIRSNVDGVLATMANFSGVYYQKDETTRALITPDMIEFTDAATYAVIKESAFDTYDIYLSKDATEKAATIEAVNEQLKTVLGAAKVWKDGKCYYYTDIRHLAAGEDKPGYYGVVRNHSYQVVITSVTGLGTPVYNPDEVIDPEQPEEEESYLAARIKVLSWRVVKSTVDLK